MLSLTDRLTKLEFAVFPVKGSWQSELTLPSGSICFIANESILVVRMAINSAISRNAASKAAWSSDRSISTGAHQGIWGDN
jgi:hypothetical protein